MGCQASSGATCDSKERPEHDATVGAFYLDKYEVTVGRFRNFVAKFDGTPPVEGAGENPLVVGSGWQTAWNSSLSASQAELISSVNCYPGNQTWTNTVGPYEAYPINCINWYEAFAFCVWDGGRAADGSRVGVCSCGRDRKP